METKKMLTIDKSLSDKFACPFVSSRVANQYHCVICNCSFRTMKTAIAHTASRSHKTYIGRWGCHISPLDNNFYTCGVCDCVIPHYGEVNKHLTAKTHQLATYRWDGEIRNENSKNFGKTTVGQVADCNGNKDCVKPKTDDIVDDDDSSSRLNFPAPTLNRIYGGATDTSKVSIGESSVKDDANCNSSNDISVTPDSGIEEIPSTSSPSDLTIFDSPVESQNFKTLKTYNQRFVDVLDSEIDIHNLGDRLEEAKLGMELCLPMALDKMYCLVCQLIVAKTMDNYYEHLCSSDHCDRLAKLLENKKNSNKLDDRFTKFELNQQYMEYVSEMWVGCLACNSQVKNIRDTIRNHTNTHVHKQKWQKLRTMTTKNFETISLRLQCDWYRVHNYSCTLCALKFNGELEFANHLTSDNHKNVLAKMDYNERDLIYDFCPTCALLYFGQRETFVTHGKCRLHKWNLINRNFATSELPQSAQAFVAKWGIQNVDAIEYVEFVSTQQEAMNEIMILDLNNRVQMIFLGANVCVFGLKTSECCTIDVFIGCEKMNDGRTLADDQILYFMMTVANWLSNDPQTWELRPLKTGGKSPVINANHKKTGLVCDISFDNGLVMGGIKLMELMDNIFPSCRILMHYLNQWLAYCSLTGSEHISNYALYWLLIFFLQTESILPSLATLKNHVETQKIDGVPLDVTDGFDYTNVNSNLRLKDLVVGFLKLYANFDFRYDVVCPLVGCAVQKRSFAYLDDLPKQMYIYVTHVNCSNNPIEFPIDSPMCLQDPFNLNHNLTKNVSKSDLMNFRIYCAKTADCFCSL